MSLLRDIVYAGAGLVSSPVWLYRLIATGKWRTDWAARFGRVPPIAGAGPTQKTLLIHAVSVGEVNAIRQLVDRLIERHGDRLRIVVSTTTDTGTARAKALFESRAPQIAVVRYPLDFTRSVRRFLDVIKPDAVALVELEVWPTFVEECRRRGVSVAVINGRLSARSYGRYRMIRSLVSATFRRLAVAAVQDEAYAERFIGMGVERDRVTVTGTMKWDTAVLGDDVPGSEQLAMAMGLDRDRPLIVCGSTGPGEERMLVDALSGGDVQIMIAPRKPERFDEAGTAMGDPVRRTKRPDGIEEPPTGNRLFLLDTLGELGKAYALADLVIVGRTFVPMGGSDMIEPIALGKPTIVGPHTENFESQMTALLDGHGVAQVAGVEHVAEAAANLLGTEAGRHLAECGRAVIRTQQGATERHVKLLSDLLNLPE